MVGELPYAEMMGDRKDLRLDPKHIGVIARMKTDGMRVVVVLTSGRPMIIDDILPYADAVVAAWLHGSEGDGVADVLFGAHTEAERQTFVLMAERYNDGLQDRQRQPSEDVRCRIRTQLFVRA